VFGLFTRMFRALALLGGRAAGMVYGTWTAYADGVNPVHTLAIGGDGDTVYTGLLALLVNVFVVLVIQVVRGAGRGTRASTAQAR
jgi:SSS family solute:Na+ symporter